MTTEDLLQKHTSSSSMELKFFNVRHSIELPNKTCALIKTIDGFITMGIWDSNIQKWWDEVDYCYGHDTFLSVVEFALI